MAVSGGKYIGGGMIEARERERRAAQPGKAIDRRALS
jgi:hypothetical protein